MKKVITHFLFCLFTLLPFLSKAWGPEGHAIVGRIAMLHLRPDVKQNVLALLREMPIDTATNWMDIMKSNADYEFMRPWHYIDYPKDQPYLPTNEVNIVNRLINTYNELKRKKTLSEEQMRFDLYVLLHLVGDLHMPLHNAYDDDLGGNKRMTQYGSQKDHNLHVFWDEDIIKIKKITVEDCLNMKSSLSGKQVDTSKGVDFVAWMHESRSLLDQVYDFKDFNIDEAYVDKNAIVVKQQLLLAGLRLAFILNQLFPSPAPLLDYKELTSQHKRGIDVQDVLQHAGKKVTVCDRVYGVRYSPKITRINVGAAHPSSPLTVIIFAKSYSKFNGSVEEYYKDKNICVKGRLELYQGKAQIVVEDPTDLMVQ